MRKFLTKGLIYLLIIYLANLVLGWGLKTLGPRYSDSSYGQVKWRDFRSLPTNSLDVLFLGSSHFLSGINPAVIDSVSGMSSYNMARVGLRPASAYVLLHEVLQHQQPEYLVLDIFHRTFIGAGYNHLYDFGYVQYEEGKLPFAMDNFSFEEISRLLFPTYLYRSNFPKLRPLLGLRSKKDNWEELHYKGYIAHHETIAISDLRQNEFVNYRFDQTKVDPNSLIYIDKLMNLCRERNIKMIWVTTPLPDICIQTIQNQKEIDNYFALLANQYQIPYLNYNKQAFRNRLSLSDKHDYSDDDHLNVLGADKISADIAQIIREKAMIAGEHH